VLLKVKKHAIMSFACPVLLLSSLTDGQLEDEFLAQLGIF